MNGHETPPVTAVVRTIGPPGVARLCLASLAWQDYPRERVDIVVVDTTPSAGTRDGLLDAWLADLAPARIRIVPAPGANLSQARNVGAAQAGGDLIAYVDHDEVAPPELLRTLVGTLLGHEWAMACGGRYVGVCVGAPPAAFSCGREEYGSWVPPGGERVDGPVEVADLPGGCAVFRRAAFERYGPFDERVVAAGDDRAWFWRARSLGARFVYDPDAWVFHLRGREAFSLPALVRTHWRYGRDLGHAARRSGEQIAAAGGLARAARYLAHGLRTGCRFGLAYSVAEVGRLAAFHRAVSAGPARRVAAAASPDGRR